MPSEALNAERAERARCLERVAAFDGVLAPRLAARAEPWANTDCAAPRVDEQLGAWLADAARRPGGPAAGFGRDGWRAGDMAESALAAAAVFEGSAGGVADHVLRGAPASRGPWDDIARAWARLRLGGEPDRLTGGVSRPDAPWPAALFVVGLHRTAPCDVTGEALVALLVDAADELVDAVESVSARALYVAAYGSVLLREREVFSRAHAAAEALLGVFETRKHALGLVGGGEDGTSLEDLCIVRSVWRLFAAMVGDHRFLNAALKLAEWTRGTVIPARRAVEPWHGLRDAFPATEAPFFSTRATALHLLAARGERALVERLAAGDTSMGDASAGGHDGR